MYEKELLVSPRDLGFDRGYAVQDFLVTHHGLPFKLPEHIDRLFKSAELIGLRINWSKTQITTWVKETLNKNDNTEKAIKIIITGGISHTMYQIKLSTIIIIIDHYLPPPSSYYEKGIKAKAVKYRRPDPEAKTTYYIK